MRRVFIAVVLMQSACHVAAAQRELVLPEVPEGFRVQLFAREPVVRNPASMAFDAHGRLFVGQGPQFRHPRPDTPGDSIKILADNDDDGRVDEVKTFAAGFNCIQSLAFKGRDLWVANAPDLTVVRDLDGDDEADQYVRVYTDLGNLEHGLHGLNWGPDGKLYMSKGNSKGLNREGRVAPLPFRQLWGVESPPDAPEIPPPQTFRRGGYEKNYHHPADDWGREGGVLRCDNGGANLEIVCRGLRNPWDVTFDDGFCWLGTDNDQTGGDKIFMPFTGAHFGWGHKWSSHWSGENHPPTVPASGPLFEGSGTGVIYCSSSRFPTAFRNVFFINDWLRHTTYVYRPRWRGALLVPQGGQLEEFVTRGRSMFNPTDIEVGPDGALWILGWGSGYGARFSDDGQQENEGRIWRIWHEDAPPLRRGTPFTKRREKKRHDWAVAELVRDLGSPVPAWRVDAQDELLRRDSKIKPQLLEMLKGDSLAKGQQTWLAWTLGRLNLHDRTIDEFFAKQVASANGRTLNRRIQAIRILAHRTREAGRNQKTNEARALPRAVAHALQSDKPRLRFEAALAIRQARQRQFTDALLDAAASETDRVTFYTLWNTLVMLADDDLLAERLAHESAPVRRAALLALAEKGSLTRATALPLRLDVDEKTAATATLWLKENGRALPPPIVIDPDGGNFVDTVEVQFRVGEDNVDVHFTLDGQRPTAHSSKYEGPFSLSQSAHLRTAMFRGGGRLGPIVAARFHQLSEADLAGRLLVNVKSSTSNTYQIVHDGLRVGAPAYTDRRYAFKGLPDDFVGATYLRTANNDADTSGEALLTLQAGEDVTLFVAHDVRAARPPRWLSSKGFVATKFELTTSDARHRLYGRDFRAGTITLGGNRDDGRGGGVSHYLVIAKPAPIKLREKPITVRDVLSLIAKGDVKRGRQLFFGKRAGCLRCHRLEQRGNEFAPSLAGIGLRAEPTYIVQSILTPSSAITEGFISQVIVTQSGKVYSGIVLQETGKTLKIALTNGSAKQIEKANIDERRTSRKSAMPDTFARYLSPQNVADLTAFLQQQKRRPHSPSE